MSNFYEKLCRRRILSIFSTSSTQRARKEDSRQKRGLSRRLSLLMGVTALGLSLAGFTYQGPNLVSSIPLFAKIRPAAPSVKGTTPQVSPSQGMVVAQASAASPARVAAPEGAFPLQRGMAIVSRLSNPNAVAPGQGSDREGFVLGVFDIRNPGENSAPTGPANWSSVTESVFRHPEWTNARMGEIFGVEVDNSVTSNPQIFVGSTGSFVGQINGAAQYTGRTIPAIGSVGGDVFRIDGTTGSVSTLTSAIPSMGYHTSGGRGATDVQIPLNTSGGGIIRHVKLVDGGSGYTNGIWAVTFTGSEGGLGGTGTITVTNGTVTDITIAARGAAYAGTITVTPIAAAGPGSGLVVDVKLGYPLQTGSYAPASGGAGYTLLAPQVMGDGTLSGLATATFSSGEVTAYNVTFEGIGYSYPPTVTVNNRFTGVGNIGYNYARNVVYTSSLNNGNIYAIDANSGNFIGDVFNHLPSVSDLELAVTDLRRLAIGMAWNPRDNRLYFSRPAAAGYTETGLNYDFTHNEIVSIGLNPDGSINTAEAVRQELLIPVTALDLLQRSLITDIEFTSDGNIALFGEMSIGNAAFRRHDQEHRFTKGSHNAIAREYRFNSAGDTWELTEEYKVGNTYSGYNNTGGVDFGYGNSENEEVYYDAAVLTGDYIDGSGFVYGIQISPLSQGNYPTNTPFNHYVIDDNVTPGAAVFAEKTGIGDVDVFSGVDFPATAVELTVVSATPASDCDENDGAIVISGTGLLPNTPYQVSYTKDGGAVTSLTVVTDGESLLNLTGLSPGEYTDINLNDLPDITSNSVSVSIYCPLPVITEGDHDNPTACDVNDGVIRIEGVSPSTQYRVEYVFEGGTPVFVTVTSDASGVLELNDLAPGAYTQVRLNDEASEQTSNSLSITLTCPLPVITEGDHDNPTACDVNDGVIRIEGVSPSTQYRVEYVFEGGTPVFVTVTSDASGVLELNDLAPGAYTQVRLNDEASEQTSNSLSITLTCPLPVIAVGIHTLPTNCLSQDGIIRLTGASPSTTYDVRYTLLGSSAVMVELQSDESGTLEITGLGRGIYNSIELVNGDETSNALAVTLTAETESECGPLPVTLARFEVRKEGQVARVDWSTTNESNSDRFDVMHSINGQEWVIIGSEKSARESSSLRTYSFVHATPSEGRNYYRLKILDQDGSYNFSDIRTEYFTNIQTSIEVSPNPVVQELRITSSRNWAEVDAVRILDLSGRQEYRSGQKPSATIQSNELPANSGVYLLIVDYQNGTSVTRRIVVTR